MAGWFWLTAAGGSYDSRAELRRCRARSSYDSALLVARLATAREFGSSGVDEDRIIGSQLWFYRSGDEAVFYLIEDDDDGADVTIVWVGTLHRLGFGAGYATAERRLGDATS